MATRTPSGLPTLLTGSAFYTAGNVLMGASKFLLVPLYVRYLSPGEYGIVGMASAVSAILTVLLMMGTERAVAREYFDYQDDPQALRSYLVTIFGFLLSAVGVLLSVLWALGPPLLNRLLRAEGASFSRFLPLTFGIAAATAFFAVFMVLLQVAQRAALYMTAQVGRFVVMVTTMLVLLRRDAGPAAPLWAELLATAFVAALLATLQVRALWRRAPVAVEMNPRIERGGGVWESFDASKLKRALLYGLPFVPYEAMRWVMGGSDRLILARFRTLHDVGLYTVGATLAMGLGVITNAFYLAYMPYFFKTAKENDRPQGIFGHVTALYTLVAGGVCLAAMLFANEVLALFAAPQYRAAATLVPMLVLAAFFSGLYSMVTLPLLQIRQTTVLPLMTVYVAVANLGLNLWLVPVMGARGAAWASVATSALLFALALRQAGRLYPIAYGRARFWGVILVVGVGGLLLQGWPLAMKVVVWVGLLLVGVLINRPAWYPLSRPRAA